MKRSTKQWSPKSEVDLAQAVIEWLESDGWDVYQEVQVDEVRADIVAFEPETKRSWIIECKRSLTFDVVAQAWRWRRLAHWVSVGVPEGPKFWTDGRKLGMEILEWKKIGFVPVGECGVLGEQVRRVPANLDADSYDLIHTCRPEHKIRAPAGTNKGGYVTEFGETVAKIEDFVRENPGADIKTVSRSIKHHYNGNDPNWTFRRRITELIRKGKIKTIRGEEKGGLLHLFLAEPGNTV